jgi:hypothetical protein
MTDPQFRRPWEVDPAVVEEQRKADEARERIRGFRRQLVLAARLGKVDLDDVVGYVDASALNAIAAAIERSCRANVESVTAAADIAAKAGGA